MDFIIDAIVEWLKGLLVDGNSVAQRNSLCKNGF